MQLKKFYQHQIEVNPLGRRNLRRVQPALCHLIDFITFQHQVGCESIMLVKKDVLIFNGQKLVQGMQVHKQLMLQIMTERIAAHHLLGLFIKMAVDKNQWLIKIERKQTQHIFNIRCLHFITVHTTTMNRREMSIRQFHITILRIWNGIFVLCWRERIDLCVILKHGKVKLFRMRRM